MRLTYLYQNLFWATYFWLVNKPSSLLDWTNLPSCPACPDYSLFLVRMCHRVNKCQNLLCCRKQELKPKEKKSQRQTGCVHLELTNPVKTFVVDISKALLLFKNRLHTLCFLFLLSVILLLLEEFEVLFKQMLVCRNCLSVMSSLNLSLNEFTVLPLE